MRNHARETFGYSFAGSEHHRPRRPLTGIKCMGRLLLGDAGTQV